VVSLKLTIPLSVLLLAGNFLCLLYVIYQNTSNGIRLLPSAFCFSNPWRNVLTIGSTHVLSQIQQLDVNLLGAVTNSAVAATYGAVSRWTNSLGIFAGSFSQTIIPVFSRQKLSTTDVVQLKKSSSWLLFSIISAICIFIFSPVIVKIILGAEYESSAGILRILALASIASTITQPTATILLSKGFVLWVFVSLLTGVVVQILVIVFLHNRLGAQSAAYGYLVGQFIAAFLLTLALIRCSGIFLSSSES